MADYCTAAEMKAACNKVTAGDDAVIALIIEGVSRTIDRFCNRPDSFFIAELDGYESTRYFLGSGTSYQYIDECIDVVSVAVKDAGTDEENQYTAWVVGAVGTTAGADVFPATGDPKHPDFVRTPYTLLIVGVNGDYSYFTPPATGFPHPTVKVKARWGYAAVVPAQIKQACIMQSTRQYKLVQGAMARATASPDLGALIYPGKLDPDVEFILKAGRFVRPAIGR